MNASERDDSTVGRAERDPQEAAVRARFRAARRAGRPHWLWPEVPVAQWRSALLEVQRIARALLCGTAPPPLRSPDAASATALGLACYTSGLGPLLGWYVERGDLEADARSAVVLATHLDHARRRTTRMEAELAAVFTALEAREIRPVVLKGTHGARRWFAEPALRPVADADLLVSPDLANAAADALCAAGYDEVVDGRRTDPPRSEWRRRGAPELPHSLMYVHADDAIAIDLHTSIDIDFFGIQRVRFDAVSSCDRAVIARFDVGVLAQPLLAAHHAVHASQGLHGLTLIRLVELVLMLRGDMRTHADWHAFETLLHDVHAARFAWPALSLAERLVPGTVPAEVLTSCAAQVPARLRRVVDALDPGTAQRIDSHALEERFMWASGVGEHLRRAAHMVVPTGRGPVRRLGRIYADRAWRLLRLTVSWSSAARAGESDGR